MLIREKFSSFGSVYNPYKFVDFEYAGANQFVNSTFDFVNGKFTA